MQFSSVRQVCKSDLLLAYANLAQMVEQLICNQLVVGSSPIVGSDRVEIVSIHACSCLSSIFGDVA